MELQSPLPDPVKPETVVPVQDRPKGSIGTMLSIIVILAIIVFGALYAWGARIAQEHQQTDSSISY